MQLRTLIGKRAAADRSGSARPGTPSCSPTLDRRDRRRVRASSAPGNGSALRDYPAEPERRGHRPNAAPAYYLGRPAGLWIALMRPGRRQTASSHPVQPVTGGGTRTLSRHRGALTGAGAGAARATPALGPG